MNYLTDEDNSDYPQKQVPASSRGGLGNIRARKQSKLDVSDESPKSPSTATSTTRSRIRRVLSVASGSTLSSGSSVYSNTDSLAVTVGSSSGAASVITGSSGGSEDYDPFPDLGSPSPLSSPLGSPKPDGTKGKRKSKTATSASTEYVSHLQADARQRALEKRHAKERAKETDMSFGQGSDEDDKVTKMRMGRGGAGVFKTVETGVDPTLHPRAATITQEYEARALAQEREIIAASRARSALKRSTGRGGSGNVGAGIKTISMKAKKGKKGKDTKGKGKASVDHVDTREDASERTAEEITALGEQDDDATIAIDDPSLEMQNDRKKKPGFRKFFRRVIRSGADTHINTGSSSSSLDENTPRPSLGDNVLEITHPPSPSYSFSSPTSSSSAPMSPQLSAQYSPRLEGSSKLTKHSRSRERIREGAELLAFVNAALPDLAGGAQNVLGVPGTPGFPFPGGKPVSDGSGGSRRSRTVPPSTPHGQMATGTVNSAVPSEVIMRSPPLRTMEEVVEEEWVDDETLKEVDDDDDERTFEEEDEDSDIDPQLALSVHKKQDHCMLPDYDFGQRPDSLDAVIRVALDKLNRAEIKEVDNNREDVAQRITDAYTLPGDVNDDLRDWRDLRSAKIPAPGQRRALPAQPPVPLVFSPTPRYLRASAPILPVRLNPGLRVVPAAKAGADPGKPRATMSFPGPPPTRPVPRLPEEESHLYEF